MSYFSPDVIVLILGPWLGIFYYSVDLWWVSDPVWCSSFNSPAVVFTRGSKGLGEVMLYFLPSYSFSRVVVSSGSGFSA